MKIDRRAFHDALKELNKVADYRATLPILSNVLLVANNGILTLTATDLEQVLQAQIPAEGEIHTCLPAKLLTNLVKPEKKSDRGDVSLEQLPDNQVTVVLDGLATKLLSLDPQDFPAGIASSDKQNWNLAAMWPAKPLLESLSYVLPASSNDETRPNLCSVHFDGENIVTTDGHRLHMAALPAPLAESILVPVTSATTLKRILPNSEQVILAKSKEYLRIKAGSWQLDTRLVDENFPNASHVIPDRDAQPTRLTVETKVFTKALTRLAKLTSEKHVKMTVNGNLTLATNDPDAGSAETEVPALSSTHKGDDLVIGFESTYLLDALKKASDTVTLGFSDSLSPLRIDLEDNRLAMVMPMRV